MHVEAFEFLCRALDLSTILLHLSRHAWRVVEIGARDVNGSPRGLIQPCRSYLGIDVRPGRGVDRVANAADPTLLAAGCCDLVVCSEVLEHTTAGEAICRNAHRWLRAGGVYLVTCAGLARPPHGCDGGALTGVEYYGGVSEEQLRVWLEPFPVALTWDRWGQDTYGLAVKGGVRDVHEER